MSMSPIVYFIPLQKNSVMEERIEATNTLIKSIGFDKIFDKNDKIGIKLHIGERNNDTHITPEIIHSIVAEVKKIGSRPFLTETSTLYRGARSDAIHHLTHAFEHGFTIEKTGAPFIMADGLVGNAETEVPIRGILFQSVNIAREITLAEGLIAVSHATGHIQAGLGGCLKNLGMGLASRIGKMRQHSSVKPYIKESLCTFCGQCIRWCPVDTIIEKDGKAFIVQDKCIGCGECLAVCSFDAVKYNWGVESSRLQRSIAEHALGVIIDKRDKVLFLNYMTDMTKDCDCLGSRQKRILPDVGILASRDPVAVDQATLDLTEQASGTNLSAKSWPKIDPQTQLEHGEKIGLGSRNYTLIKP